MYYGYLPVKHSIPVLFAIVLFLLAACGDKPAIPASPTPQPKASENAWSIPHSDLDQELIDLAKRHGLTGDPTKGRQLPNINTPLAQLGIKLFFSRTLSGDLDVACATCHHPALGGGDNLSLSIGTNSNEPDMIGHHRKLKHRLVETTPRNTPTTFNIGLWDKVMFHDGRIESLEQHPGKNGSGAITTPDVAYPATDPLAGNNLVHAQARFPVTSATEMRGETFEQDGTPQSCRVAIAERLGGYGAYKTTLPTPNTAYWLDAFRQAFNAPDGLPQVLINEQNISAALSEYERSQVFVNNPWKAYLKGNPAAISEAAKQGALLFFKTPEQKGFGCVNCHQGDAFTDEDFHHTLMPPLGPGKNKLTNDYGRWLVTNKPEDKFKFRTPSLLNVEVTGPWGHNGAYTSLANAVRHMLNPYRMALHYDAGQLQQTNLKKDNMRDNLREMFACDVALPSQEHTEEQVRQLVAFLLTLTDPCVKDRECLSPWIPDNNAGIPMQLKAKGDNGKPL